MSAQLPPGKYKCMYQHCRSASLDDSAVCALHRNFEIAITAIIGFVGVGLLYWFIDGFSQHLSTRIG